MARSSDHPLSEKYYHQNWSKCCQRWITERLQWIRSGWKGKTAVNGSSKPTQERVSSVVRWWSSQPYGTRHHGATELSRLFGKRAVHQSIDWGDLGHATKSSATSSILWSRTRNGRCWINVRGMPKESSLTMLYDLAHIFNLSIH